MEQKKNRTKGKTLKNYGGVIKWVISGNRATMVEILRSRDQIGPLWWRFSSAIVALYSLGIYILFIHKSSCHSA